MIDRRTVLISLAGAAAWPTRAVSQQSKRLPVVAIVASTPLADLVGSELANLPLRAFLAGLRDRGWIDGQSVTILRHSAEGKPERASAILTELAARGVEVMFIGGASFIHVSARAATKDVPVVAVFAGDPVTNGFVSSLARPGGNMTGVMRNTGPELYGKWLQLLREVSPGITHTAFLSPGDALSDFNRVAHNFGMKVLPIRVDLPGEVDAALTTMVRQQADSFIVPAGPQFHVHAKRIAAFAFERKLPALFGIREVVDAGGLMSYGPNVQAEFRYAAKYVDQILRGAKPGELPVEQPTTFEMVVNLKTARALGLTIPPSILIRADEVIE